MSSEPTVTTRSFCLQDIIVVMREWFDSDLDERSKKWLDVEAKSSQKLSDSAVFHTGLFDPGTQEDVKKHLSKLEVDESYTQPISSSRCERFFYGDTPLAPDCFIPNSVVREKMNHVIIKKSSLDEKQKLYKLLFNAESEEDSEKSLDSETRSSDVSLPIDQFELDSLITFQSSRSFQRRKENDVLVKEGRKTLGIENAELHFGLLNLLSAKQLLTYRKQMRNKDARKNDTNEESTMTGRLGAEVESILTDDALSATKLLLASKSSFPDTSTFDYLQTTNKFSQAGKRLRDIDLPSPLKSKYQNFGSSKKQKDSIPDSHKSQKPFSSGDQSKLTLLKDHALSEENLKELIDLISQEYGLREQIYGTSNETISRDENDSDVQTKEESKNAMKNTSRKMEVIISDENIEPSDNILQVC